MEVSANLYQLLEPKRIQWKHIELHQDALEVLPNKITVFFSEMFCNACIRNHLSETIIACFGSNIHKFFPLR